MWRRTAEYDRDYTLWETLCRRLAVVQGLKWWLRRACAALGLEEYLLRDSAAAGGNVPPAFIPHGMPGSARPPLPTTSQL